MHDKTNNVETNNVMTFATIKKQLFLIAVIMLFLGISACEDDFNATMEGERQQLDALMTEIKAMSEQIKCENAADWKFRAIGARGCGGPTGYVSYSIKIDTNAFIQKVNKYTEEQIAFNKKWNVMSTCELRIPPKSIVCENGKPKQVY